MNVRAALPLVSVAHLLLIGVWVGVVATEAVIELFPARRPDAHGGTIRLHYWIDLLVELPVLCGVTVTGVTLAVLAWPLSTMHALKLACAALAIAANLVCIALVIRRHRRLAAGGEDAGLWSLSRAIRVCALVGIPFGGAAAAIGAILAHARALP